jgi:hypothetical protein
MALPGLSHCIGPCLYRRCHIGFGVSGDRDGNGDRYSDDGSRLVMLVVVVVSSRSDGVGETIIKILYFECTHIQHARITFK